MLEEKDLSIYSLLGFFLQNNLTLNVNSVKLNIESEFFLHYKHFNIII